MVKNATYKGITLFLVELRKNLKEGKVSSGFWREMTGRTSLPINYEFKDVKHETLHQLINWFIENHEDVSDLEFNELVNYMRSAFWILDRKAFFMLEIKDDKGVEEKASEDVATDSSTDSVSNEEDNTVDSEDSLPEETEEQVPSKEDNEPQETVVDYNALSDDELLVLAKEAKIKGAHNMKREKMIAKLSEKSI